MKISLLFVRWNGGIKMAQLIKLQDYVSRYQIDLKRYPTQYVRLKHVQWKRMNEDWRANNHTALELEELMIDEQDKKPNLFTRLFKRKEKELWNNPWEQDSSTLKFEDTTDDLIPDEVSTLNFNPTLLYNPQNEDELKRMYLDQLFHFQLKWASSTLREKSHLDPKYQRDTWLRTLVQKLPDTYFVLYDPILQLKKAPIEVGVIILAPTECYVVQLIEEEDVAAFTGDSKERFWTKKIGEQDKRVLNPLIGLKRMEKVVHQIFEEADVSLDIHRILLSRNGYIDYPGSIYDIKIIDRRHYDVWFEELKRNASPMKHLQFKAAEALLEHSQTTSFNRADWYKTKDDVEKFDL